ncbi:hypothetical protein BRADI_2g56802v3 [Brachypodium distachyon]|uniref:Uncharacterized protein n=1 Tax=Brachypodium distachyon TaxID=15368 RepID=A0A2K2DG88_BRADI|nr:hypothetical protein BRADI_2g56802v3 [Brachypodium distachyon]
MLLIEEGDVSNSYPYPWCRDVLCFLSLSLSLCRFRSVSFLPRCSPPRIVHVVYIISFAASFQFNKMDGSSPWFTSLQECSGSLGTSYRDIHDLKTTGQPGF